MAYETLTARLNFRLRQDERELLEEAADASNRRLSDWLRVIAVQAAKQARAERNEPTLHN